MKGKKTSFEVRDLSNCEIGFPPLLINFLVILSSSGPLCPCLQLTWPALSRTLHVCPQVLNLTNVFVWLIAVIEEVINLFRLIMWSNYNSWLPVWYSVPLPYYGPNSLYSFLSLLFRSW